jgi:hypothetical protein
VSDSIRITETAWEGGHRCITIYPNAKPPLITGKASAAGIEAFPAASETLISDNNCHRA